LAVADAQREGTQLELAAAGLQRLRRDHQVAAAAGAVERQAQVPALAGRLHVLQPLEAGARPSGAPSGLVGLALGEEVARELVAGAGRPAVPVAAGGRRLGRRDRRRARDLLLVLAVAGGGGLAVAGTEPAELGEADAVGGRAVVVLVEDHDLAGDSVE